MAKFVSAINCIDGRAQIPVIEYLEKSLSVDYVGMITEPGPNTVLSENSDIDTIGLLKEKINISIEKHNSNTVVIVGHHDCVANPESEEIKKIQLLDSIDIIFSQQLG